MRPLKLTRLQGARLLGKEVMAKAKPASNGEGSELERDFLASIPDLPPPAREHRFHPIRRWRLDFAWPALQVAVEVHGATHAKGRHTRGKGYEQDREKMNEAALMGWLVIEVTAGQVRSGQAAVWAKQALERKG